MNKERRKQLNEAEKLIEQAKEIIDTCREEEEEYKNNMPENMRGSEKWDKAEETVDILDNIISNIEEAIESLGEVVN